MTIPNKKSVFGLIILMALILLFILRSIGEAAFSVSPEVKPAFTQHLDTSLFKAVDQLLNNSDSDKADTLFVPLKGAHLALVARLELAQVAQKTLDLQYYLFHDDEVGRALLGAAIEAAERGVEVRLLLDDMDTAGREDEFARLSNEYKTLDIRVFNPVYTRSLRLLDYLARFPRSTRRMHNKSLSADNITAVVGGRNIGGEYFDVNAETVFADLDVLAAGAVAKEVKIEFDDYWYSGIGVDIRELSELASDADYAVWRDAIKKDLKHYQEIVRTLGKTAVSQLSAGDLNAFYGTGRVIYDKPDKVISRLFDQSGWLAPQIIEAMSSAQEELLIVSPYFIPGDNGVELFRKMVARGVDITILTNSAVANDVIAVHAGYMDYRKELLKAGVKLYELKPTPMVSKEKKSWALQGSKNTSLHAKTFLVDKRWSFVGSFNLDPRSAIHNTEMGVIFDNSEYGQGASEFLKSKLPDTAYRLQLDESGGLSWIEHQIEGNKHRELSYTTEPGTSFLTRTGLYLMSWLPVEWLL